MQGVGAISGDLLSAFELHDVITAVAGDFVRELSGGVSDDEDDSDWSERHPGW